MTVVSLLFTIKIIGTLVLVVLPFMFWPREKLDKVVKIETITPTFYRLYAMAIIALLVGYGGGIHMAGKGDYPVEFLIMGLVSNLGATSILVGAGAKGKQKISIVLFGSISVGCMAALFWPNLAMAPLF